MSEAVTKLVVTLHWHNATGLHSTTAICDDRPPVELMPLLLDGCGLPRTCQDYHLRLDTAEGRRLADELPISAGGVRNGSQLWLSTVQTSTQLRCLITLPTGEVILIPQGGIVLQRAWLLGHLALLAQARPTTESGIVLEERADYRWVARQDHCLLAPHPAGWRVTSLRADRVVLLNGVQLIVDQPMPLRHEDRLTLGEAGPTLVVSLLLG